MTTVEVDLKPGDIEALAHLSLRGGCSPVGVSASEMLEAVADRLQAAGLVRIYGVRRRDACLTRRGREFLLSRAKAAAKAARRATVAR